MTPEDIDRLVATLDRDGIVKATAGLTEAERRKLSTHASDLLKLANRVWNAWEPKTKAKPRKQLSEQLKPHRGKGVWPDDGETVRTAELVCLAVCPISVTRKIGCHWDADDGYGPKKSPHRLTVLLDRRPDWTDEWLAAQCEGEFPGIDWPSARRLIEAGVCSKPNTDSYISLFALNMLKALDKAKRLDDAAFVETIAPAFDVRTKGPAKTALTLLKRVVKRDQALTAPAAGVVVAALRHESEDIQAGALGLLETWEGAITAETADQVEAMVDDLPATLGQQAGQLLGKLGREVESADEVAVADASEFAADLRARAEALDKDVCQAIGVDQAIAALERGDPPPPLSFDIMQVPVLKMAEPVTPINDMEELIDAVAHAIEVVDDAMEVERIFDGMCRLLDQRPDDFAERTAPLRKRVEPQEGYTGRAFGDDYDVEEIVSLPLVRWLKCTKKREKTYQADIAIHSWLCDRCSEIAGWIDEGVPRPVLAMPTHAGGWLDPKVLVERLQCLESMQLTPGRLDLMQALLRLTPDGRNEALAAGTSLGGEAGQVVRWALGEPTPDKRLLAKQDAGLWLAAGRSRWPRARLEDLETHAKALKGPDGIEPAIYDWNTTVQRGRDNYTNRNYTIPRFELKRTPTQEKKTGLVPIDLHGTGDAQWQGTESRWLIGWRRLIWPSNADPIFAAGAIQMGYRIDDKASVCDPNDEYAAPLLDPDRPSSDLAKLVLAIGLTSVDAEVKGLSLDVLIEGIDDGRITGEELGGTLARLAPVPGWLKLNRVGGNLAEAARVSPLHAYVAAGCIQLMLAVYDELPRDAHHLLGLLLQLLTQLGLPLSAEARAPLEGLKGSSKTAKLAKGLLAHAPEGPTADYLQAVQRAAEARVERAERWNAN